MRFDSVRYCIMRDGDGHQWLIPAAHRASFQLWLDMINSDGFEDALTEPTYAIPFEGELLTFVNPELDGRSV